MEKRGVWLLVLRYVLIIAAIFALPLFYILLRPITTYLSYGLIRIFYYAQLSGNFISLHGYSIEIIDACVAGIAYFLLLALNLSTRLIGTWKRVWLFLFTSVVFLIVNVIRIFLMTLLLVNQSSWFDTAHLVLWYALSIVFVFLIWVLSIKVFRIKEIPVYSDVKAIFRR
jgi:exosortase/archaeosortase family protein